MKKKKYTFVKIDVYSWEEEDIVTLSAPNNDSQKDNDVIGNDIFD